MPFLRIAIPTYCFNIFGLIFGVSFYLGPEETGITGVNRVIEYPLVHKIPIQSAKLGSLSCSNFFYLASCSRPDNNKRHRCKWRAFGVRKPTYLGR